MGATGISASTERRFHRRHRGHRGPADAGERSVLEVEERDELGAVRRPGQALRTDAARGRRQYVRENWRLLAVVGAAFVILMLPTIVIQHRALRGFWLGVVVSSAVWMLIVLIREESGTNRLEEGAGGEELTAARLLRPLERQGWRSVHDVEFDGFNVDHVAVGPGGVLAVESKRTTGHWDIKRPALIATSPRRSNRLGSERMPYGSS